jgi:Tol biopolymer transport system component
VLVTGLAATAGGLLTPVSPASASPATPPFSDGYSYQPTISGDGRFVAFQSAASNLVPGDTNRMVDVFVRDLAQRSTTRVSVGNYGEQADGDSIGEAAGISGHGRYVAFSSRAGNLVALDRNDAADVFVRDTVARTTRRVSVSSAGAEADGHSDNPSISDDGRYVTFSSTATNLVTDDTNGRYDVFRHDLRTGATIRVSVTADGRQLTGESGTDDVNADGSVVAFSSAAPELSPGRQPAASDVYVRNLRTGTVTLASPAVRSTPAENRVSYVLGISDDGTAVAIYSNDDLAPGPPGPYAVFIRDLVTGTTRAAGPFADAEHQAEQLGGALSGDGRVTAFSSAAPLDPGDTNDLTDVYRRELCSTGDQLVSVGAGGRQSTGQASWVTLDRHGRRAAFAADGSNLTADDGPAGDVFVRDTVRGTTTLVSAPFGG